MKRWIVPTSSVLFALTLNDCVGTDGPGGPGDITCSTATFDVAGNRVATFGTSADAKKLEAFLQATIDLNNAVAEIDSGLISTCTAIGNDLGIPASEYVATSSGEARVATVCNRVIREVRTILSASLPRGVALDLRYTPPVCRVDLTFAAMCTAQCDVTASASVPTCRGTLVADCSASCTGSCSGSCAASCTGQCNGTCTGQCMGTCRGQCTGTCDVTDATGRCVGHCSGACAGECSANCMGECQGSCSAGCTGSCTGQCRGMCTGSARVYCDGEWDVQADAQCTAACRAQANARATCTEPRVTAGVQGTVDAANLARLQRLIASLQTHYGEIAKVSTRIATVLTQTVPTFAQSVNGVGTAAGHIGLSAVACVTRAGVVAAEAASKFQASASVTVSFSASVSVQGGAQ